MSGATDKIPPTFNTSISYTEWKKQLGLWVGVTCVQNKLPKKTHGPLVYLNSFRQNERAQKAVEALTQAELETEEGVNKITTLLDSIFMLAKKMTICSNSLRIILTVRKQTL